MTHPILGIELSKDRLDAALIVEGKRRHEHFENSESGFKWLITWISKQTDAIGHVCMETTGPYSAVLGEVLYRQGWQVSIVNPMRIKAYVNRKSHRNKTDKVDAQWIAEYCLHENPPLWTPPPSNLTEAEALARRLEELQSDYQLESDRLQSGDTHPIVIEDIQDHLEFLKKEIDEIQRAIRESLA
jgi:transposase